MADWFYTDSDAAQQGPVDDEALLRLNRDGDVTARSLVWRDGMEQWAPFRDVASSLFGEGEDGVPVEIGVCAFSGRVYPVSEMMPYGEAVIGVEHKDAFIQQLMESGAVEIEDATERTMDYVGFWWRCLSSFLDYLIKMVPSWICMIPYYVVAMTAGVSGELEEENEIAPGFTVAIALAYGVGLLGMLAVSIFYETWMVGKYQGTLGKLIIGAKVVNPDGTRLTYKRAFVRWLAKKPLNYVLVFGPSSVGFGLVMAGIFTASEDAGAAATFGLAMMTGFFVYAVLLVLCCGVYWMAAFDSEKRALHDRVASTRVVRK